MKDTNPITMKLKRSNIERKTQVQNDWELSSINFDLFPIEILDPAARALVAVADFLDRLGDPHA